MTTSPVPEKTSKSNESSSSTPSSTPSPAPSSIPREESAKAIGFELVKHYYTTLSTKVDSIYGMYAKNAALQHHSPFSGDFSKIESLYSRDSIKEYYQHSTIFSNAKILIHNLDAQPSLDESVMVLCHGEIAFNDKSGLAFKFVQSFYITAKKADNVTYYDIVNDILRFIPDVDSEFELNGTTSSTTEPASTTVELLKPKESSKEESKDEVPKSEPTEVEEEVKEEKVTEEKKLNEEAVNEEEEVSLQSKRQISWAARIAPKSSNGSAPTQPKGLSTPGSSKDKPASNGNSKKKQNGSSPTPASKKSPGKKEDTANGKLKKKFTNKKNEEVYPIYIKGIRTEVDTEAQLSSALESRFGKVDSCRLNNHVAFVDFAKQSLQEKALKVGAIKLNDHELKLEPRVDKKKDSKK